MSRSTTVAPKKENTAVVVVEINKALSSEKAELIKTNILAFCQRLEDLEPEYKALVESESQVFTPALAKKADVLLKKYVKLRGSNGSEGTRKFLKDDSLLEGREIDGAFGKVRDAAKDREAQLLQIKNYVELEEKRIEEELQMDRYRELEGYILEEDELHQKLGLMVPERWEEYFLEVRAVFQAHEEKKALEKLTVDRITEVAPYSLLIDDYTDINWGTLKEKRYKEILQTAKDKWDAQEAEKASLQKKVNEQEALEKRFTERLSLLTGCKLEASGAYYNGDIVLTTRELKEHTEEDFANLLFNHLEDYTKDQEAEAKKKEAEAELVRKQEAEKARLHAAGAAADIKRREEAARIAAEEERLMALKHKEVNSTDADKFREYAIAWASLEIPTGTSEAGGEVEEKLAGMVRRGVEWINANAEKL